jgi:hypothetical protein
MSTGAYLDRCFFDPVAECFTDEVARRVVNVRIDPVTLERISQLAENANEGTISADEDAEYKEFIEASDLLAILQAKALDVLSQQLAS